MRGLTRAYLELTSGAERRASQASAIFARQRQTRGSESDALNRRRSSSIGRFGAWHNGRMASGAAEDRDAARKVLIRAVELGVDLSIPPM